MLEKFIINQKAVLHILKSRAGFVLVSLLVLFLLLNTLKVALFNYYIVPNQTMDAFRYKLMMSFVMVFFSYTVILSIRSRSIFIFAYLIQISYILINLSYFFFYQSYLNIVQFIMLFEEGFKAVKNSSAPLNFKMLTVFMDLPVFLFIAYNYLKVYELRKRFILYRVIAVLASIAVIVSVQMSYYSNNNFITTILKDRYRGESPIVQWYGTLFNNAASVLLKGNENELISSFKYGREMSHDGNSRDNPNFIIIQVEAMDSNIINKKYKNQFIMPYLKSLSDKNIYYPYMMSYHKGGGTSDTEFSIINSIEPLEGFPSIKLSNYSYMNSMLKRLSDNLYTNVAFHGNSDVFFNRDTAFPKMGFNELYDIDKMGLKHQGWGAPDKNVFNFAMKTIKDLEEPYLAYIITMSSHTPFTNVSNYYNKSTYDDISTKRVKNYFNSMSYVDECIKQFINETRDDNTYIIIYGDHTPNIEADIYKQASFSEDGKYFEFVPLLIMTPNNKKYKGANEVASFLDISPTVLNNSGISFDIKSDGRDLIDTDSESKEIPFKGSKYDREYLIERILEH